MLVQEKETHLEKKTSSLTYKLCHFALRPPKGGCMGKMAELRLKKKRPCWKAQSSLASTSHLFSHSSSVETRRSEWKNDNDFPHPNHDQICACVPTPDFLNHRLPQAYKNHRYHCKPTSGAHFPANLPVSKSQNQEPKGG